MGLQKRRLGMILALLVLVRMSIQRRGEPFRWSGIPLGSNELRCVTMRIGESVAVEGWTTPLARVKQPEMRRSWNLH